MCTCQLQYIIIRCIYSSVIYSLIDISFDFSFSLILSMCWCCIQVYIWKKKGEELEKLWMKNEKIEIVFVEVKSFFSCLIDRSFYPFEDCVIILIVFMESDRSKEMLLLSMTISTRILRCRSMIFFCLSLSLAYLIRKRWSSWRDFYKYYQLRGRDVLKSKTRRRKFIEREVKISKRWNSHVWLN